MAITLILLAAMLWVWIASERRHIESNAYFRLLDEPEKDDAAKWLERHRGVGKIPNEAIR